jgi:hypothetical protein
VLWAEISDDDLKNEKPGPPTGLLRFPSTRLKDATF